MFKPGLSSMKIFASASFDAAAVSLGKSRSARKVPSRTFCEFTPAREQRRRWTSCCALISRLKTATGRFSLHRDMLGDVHRQGRLAHARPRRDHDHFRGVQAARQAIKILEPGGEAGDAAMLLVKLFDRLDRVHDLVFHRKDCRP